MTTLAKYPLIGIFTWLVSYSFFAPESILSNISLIVGVVVALITGISQALTLTRQYHDIQIRRDIRRALNSDNEELTNESLKVINNLIGHEDR